MKTGTWARVIATNEQGFVVGHTLDGIALHLDSGRVSHFLPKELEAIPTPAGPEPALPTPRRPQSADPANFVVKTGGLSVMQNGEWR